MIKLFPLDHGKHDNLHMKFVIGPKKSPTIRLHIITFFETGYAYIADAMYKLPKEFINFDFLEETLKKKLSAYDFSLELISPEDWFNKQVSTNDILQKLKKDE